MPLKKIVGIFYLIYTVYILLICWLTDVTPLYIFSGLTALWVMYGCFLLGDRAAGRWGGRGFRRWALPRRYTPEPAWTGLLWGCGIFLAAACSVVAIHFYTGQWPVGVLDNLRSGVSNYYTYQFYFPEHGALLSTVQRLPYILMMAFSKFIFVTGLLYWCLLKPFTPRHLVVAVLCCLGQLYISLGRGTNFEMYELTILAVFIVLKKCRFELSLRRFGRAAVKPLLACLCAGIVLVCVYYVVLASRHYYANVYISQDIHYNATSLPAQLVPELSLLVLNLFGYLGFGLYYISSFFNLVAARSASTLFATLCPLGFRLLTGESTMTIMERTIDVGVMWHADFVNFINTLGLPGTLALIALLGFLAGRLERGRCSVWSGMAGYFLLLQMLAFPVGNFVLASSANILLIGLSAVMLLLQPADRSADPIKEGNQYS